MLHNRVEERITFDEIALAEKIPLVIVRLKMGRVV